MKTMTGKFLEACRVTTGQYASDKSFGFNGAFFVPVFGLTLKVICSDGSGWDHVSVSRPDRCPTWEEMAEIKSLFFDDHECVMQLHPPKSDYVNNHSYCLHLWRPQAAVIPRPPSEFVGARELGVLA